MREKLPRTRPTRPSHSQSLFLSLFRCHARTGIVFRFQGPVKPVRGKGWMSIWAPFFAFFVTHQAKTPCPYTRPRAGLNEAIFLVRVCVYVEKRPEGRGRCIEGATKQGHDALCNRSTTSRGAPSPKSSLPLPRVFFYSQNVRVLVFECVSSLALLWGCIFVAWGRGRVR